MAEYFIGRREIDSFVVELDRGNKVLEITVTDYWHLIADDAARCGATGKLELSRKTGVRETEKIAFENSIGASIGAKAIAEIKAQTKENLDTEISWEIIQEEKRTVEFPSPKCGVYEMLQYQKLREYHFVYQEKKWFHKNSWQRYLTEYTNKYHDDSKTIEPDPSCSCEPQQPRDYDGLLHADFGSVSMLVPYNKIEDGIELDLAGKKAKINSTGDSSFEAKVPKEYIPESLLFLGKMEKESYDTTFKPYSEPKIAKQVEAFASNYNTAFGSSEEGGVEMEG